MQIEAKLSQLREGELNPLSLYIELKQLEGQLKLAMDEVQPLAIDEALKYPEKSFKFQNCIIEKRNTPSTWDYSNVQAYQQVKERLKYIEKVSQAGGGFDAETTEEIGKAIKIEGRQTISVKLGK